MEVVEALLDVTRVGAKPIYDMASEVPLILYDVQHDNVNWIYPEGRLFPRSTVAERSRPVLARTEGS